MTGQVVYEIIEWRNRVVIAELYTDDEHYAELLCIRAYFRSDKRTSFFYRKVR